MSDRVVQSVSDTSGRSVQPMQTYQSLWMSHWRRASCKATAGTLNLETGKGPAVTETRTSEMMNDCIKMGTERFGFGSSNFKLSRKTDDMQVQRAVSDRNFERGKCVDVNGGTQFPSILREVPLDGGTTKNPLQWIKDHPSAEESNYVAMKPLQETFAEPSSLSVLYKHDLGKYELQKGKSGVSSLICGADVFKNNFQNTNLRMQEHISCNKHSQPADLVCQENKDGRPQSKNFTNECFRESNESLLFDIPSTSHNHLPTFNQEWFQKTQKCSGLRPYPDLYIVSEETEAKKSYYNSYSLHKLPNCLHNVETMRISTTMEGNLRDFPRFSQTSHSLLITKTTDFNLSNEFDIFDGTRVITEVNGNIAGQGNQGVILQQLSCSAESERNGHVKDVKTRRATINNDSSAETDAMDIDYFKEKNLYSGANSSPSDKAFNMCSNLSYPVDVFSSRETESQGPNTELPNINLELPALPAAAASPENSGPSSSKTQSLEMDMLMAHAEPSKPNYILSPEESREADPGNRWVKRLKLSSSQSSSRGTKSSDPAGNSHDKKMKKHFGRSLRNGMPSSEPYSRKHHGKESMAALDNKGTLFKQNIDITVSPIKKNTEMLLSQPWIQRWLPDESRNSAQEYSETKAVCAPQSSKLAMENHQKEQFPSIRAMALMGKAMRGFQPCDLQKRGSFTVWNAKTI